jgi:transposase
MKSTETYHLRLATFLHDRGIGVSMVNPLSIKRFSLALMLRTKTDKADSLLPVEYGETFAPPLWKMSEAGYAEIRRLMWPNEQLMKQEVAMSNQLEALAVALEKESFDHLTGIPGIGRKTAIVLLAVTGEIKAFKSARQLSSCFGLCPRICDSGSSVKGKVRIFANVVLVRSQ